jgi:hypothetical protein
MYVTEVIESDFARLESDTKASEATFQKECRVNLRPSINAEVSKTDHLDMFEQIGFSKFEICFNKCYILFNMFRKKSIAANPLPPHTLHTQPEGLGPQERWPGGG